MGLASTAIGVIAGKGAGAATALQGEKYNRQLHDDEKARLKALAHGDPVEEAKLAAAACYLVHCAAQYPKDSAAHAYFSRLEAAGSQLTSEQALLQQQSDTHYIYLPSLMRFGPQMAKRKETTQLFDYSGGDAFSDDAKRLNSTYSLTTRTGGLLQAAGGTLTMAGSALGTVGSAVACPETALSCAGVPLGIAGMGWGLDQGSAGLHTAWSGATTRTHGGEFIQNTLGLSPQAAELLYGLPGMAVGGLGASEDTAAVLGDIARFGSSEDDALSVSELARQSYIPFKGNFTPHGLDVTPEVMDSPVAKDMVQQYVDSGVLPENARQFAKDQLETGEALPKVMDAPPDMELIKVVPKNADGGDTVSTTTPFFMTRQEYEDNIVGKSSSEIANYLGLPAEQGIRGSQLGFDVYEMTPKPGTTPVIFESKVARITQGKYSADGGANQIIVPNRKEWTDPNEHPIGQIKVGY